VATVTRSAARIQQSMRFMRSAHRQALSVEQLARQVAMSPSHYAHSFREVAGVSPMRYLRDLRLDEARDLLLRGGLQAAAVATQVGFESSAHFSREFKSRFEASPTAYVKRMREVSSGSQ
jgi:AraC-like DNA-binding protein